MSHDPARFKMLMDRYHALDDRKSDYAQSAFDLIDGDDEVNPSIFGKGQV